MALKLNLPSLKNVGPGSTAAKAVGGVKIPRAVNSKALFTKPPAVKKTQQQVSPYDQFTLKDPYDPATISQTAQTGYNADVANAQRLASMGLPTNDQLAGQAQQRSTNVNSIYQDLASRLAGVQQATVAQGNAGSAALGAQNAQAAGTMPNIAGAPVSASPIPTTAVQAVLGAQTAASGNYGGTLQSAALSAGVQGAQKALDAGSVAQQDNTNTSQRALASLLSGLPSESAREATMTTANQGVDATNLQTKLSVYQNLVTAKTTADTLGNKNQQAIADNDLKKYIAQMDNKTKVTLGIASAKAKIATTTSNNRTKAQIAADNRAAAGQRTQAQIDAANKRARESNATSAANNKRTNAAKTTVGGKPVKSYQVTVLMPASQQVDPNTGKITLKKAYRKSLPVNAAVWQRYVASGPVNKRKKSILGIPDDAQVQQSTAKS